MNDTNQSTKSVWLQKEQESLRGSTLRTALLAIINKYDTIGGIYGYQISLKMAEFTQGELDATNATFYAILRRLEKDGLIWAQLKESVSGPPRKHYFLTGTGRTVLAELLRQWEHSLFILNLVNKAHAEEEQL